MHRAAEAVSELTSQTETRLKTGQGRRVAHVNDGQIWFKHIFGLVCLPEPHDLGRVLGAGLICEVPRRPRIPGGQKMSHSLKVD